MDRDGSRTLAELLFFSFFRRRNSNNRAWSTEPGGSLKRGDECKLN